MANRLTPFQFEQSLTYIKDIGSGTYGQVFQYQQKESQQHVAVKSITTTQFDELAEAMQELTLLSCVMHPNIVQIKNFCMMQKDKVEFGRQSEEYQLLLVMELADYSLDYQISKRVKENHRFSSKSLFWLVYDLSSALYYMQKLKISHRDLKPHNILQIKGRFQLTDFGVSKKNIDSAKNMTLAGSPSYLSPILRHVYESSEQSGKHNLYKSDMFSLGLVVLYCTTMTDPTGLNGSEVMQNEVLKSIDQDGIHDKWVSRFLENALEFKEEKRWDFLDLYKFITIVKEDYVGKVDRPKTMQDLSTQESKSDFDYDSMMQTSNPMSSSLFNIMKNSEILDSDLEKQIKREDTLNVQSNFLTPDQINQLDSVLKEQEMDYTLLLSTVGQIKIKQGKENLQKLLDGSKFKGKLVGGKREGQGECQFTNGFYYNGGWQNDQFDGSGVAAWEDGRRYQGEWKKGLRHGNGIMYYTNGDVYQGEYFEDVKQGKGLMNYAHCEKYEGDYVGGQREGKGQYFYSDGKKYEGEWKNNQRSGQGKLVRSKNQLIYQGNWDNNVYHGHGKEVLEDGKIFEGIFKNGGKQGPGILKDPQNPSKEQKVIYADNKLVN